MPTYSSADKLEHPWSIFFWERVGAVVSQQNFLPIAREQVEAGCSLCPTTFTKRQKDINHTKICSKATQHLAKSQAFSMLDLLPSHLSVTLQKRGALSPGPPNAPPGLAVCFEALNSQIQRNRIHSAPGWQCWTRHVLGWTQWYSASMQKTTLKLIDFVIFSWPFTIKEWKHTKKQFQSLEHSYNPASSRAASPLQNGPLDCP